MNKLLAMTAGLLATTAIAAAPALAADNSAELAKQVQALQQQLTNIQKQLEASKANDAAMKEALEAETEAREASEKAAREAAMEAGGTMVFSNGKQRVIPGQNPKVVQSGTNRFSMSSPDNAWTIAPTGRLHFDFGGYLNQKPQGTTGPGTVAGGKLTGGINVRRARLGVSIKANNDFTASLILDAGGATDGAATINQAQIGYTGIRNTILEAGYFASYFTMDESTSSNDIMFIERSSPANVAASFNAADPRGQIGFRTWEPRYWIGAYLTSSAPNTQHALTRRQLGAYQRATFQVYDQGLQNVHVGVAAAQVFDVPNSGPGTAPTFTLADRAELRIDPTNILNTGALGTLANPVTGVQVYNVETAAAFGSFFYQGEYFNYNVERRGKTKAKFDGGYVQASYTIGGRRAYTQNCGCYGGVNPVLPFSPAKGDFGAIEFAARVSVLDLVDQFDPTQLATAPANFNSVNGGKQTNYTLGVNWYWNSNMLWKFNYIHTDFDKSNARTAAIATPIPAGLKIDAVGARFQVMF